MRVAGITATGGPVELLELPGPPAPTSDEVVIEIRASGVGNWDRFVQRGDWDVGISPPMALGVEAAGVVLAAGGCARVSVGDEVMAHAAPLRHQGTWAERALVAADTVAPKPRTASWDEAAAFPVPALTAAQALDSIGVLPGQRVLVTGAGGVTGGLVVHLALAQGAAVIATAGPESLRRLEALGAVLVDHRRHDWPEAVRKLTAGTGADATVNARVGEAAVAITATADGGRLATITGDPPPSERGIRVADVHVQADGTQLAELATLLGAGALTVAASYPLDQAADALARVVAGAAGGAIVLHSRDLVTA
jgi:NADPH:quinone reductase-like Zn-dependent oxidoreductase